MIITATAAWISLLVLASPQAPAKATVSLVDVLVEGQTLYTLAVDKQQESLTAALDLAHQAQRAVADDMVRKRLSGGVRPDPQDLTVLGSLRARIAILVKDIEKRREYFNGQFVDIQKLLQKNRLDEAQSALQSLPADAPTADPACPFADLRAELDQAVALARLQAANTSPNKKVITQGIIWTALFTGVAVAAHSSMNGKLDDMYYLPAGSNLWWSTYDDAQQMRKIRNGFAVAAFGMGAAFTIYGAARHHSASVRPFSPFGPRTWVGFNFDPHKPAIQVVRIF